MEQDTALIKEMMERYEQPVRTTPTTDIPATEVVARAKMIVEEVVEYLEAAGLVTNLPKKGEIEIGVDPFKKPDMVEIADGLVDIVVTVKGGYLVYGIDGDAIMKNEVMPSNLNKAQLVDGRYIITKVNGKTQKPEGWVPPDIKKELKRQGWISDE